MKIDAHLDYATILQNQARPVHLALKLQAPAVSETSPRRPMAFCAILDRSGSMSGAPLDRAKTACQSVIRNLRADDQFALVAFDDRAEVVIPMQPITDRAGAIEAVRRIGERGMTNLTAGWMLGRDELGKTDPDTNRRVLLLSDGALNTGITEPDEVARIVSDGLERARIRTSTLGFGENYNEDLLERLATATGGAFYDANSPEKLPAIFEAELEGLQKISAQNVRVRVRKLDFCDQWMVFASYHAVNLPDGRMEIALGDLISDESVTVVFHLEVLPLPLLPDGSAVASLEGEALLELEILWDDLSGAEIRSLSHLQTIRILATQNPADVIINEDVIPAIAAQCAGMATEEATRAATRGDVEEALRGLETALGRLRSLGNDARAVDGMTAIEDLMRRLREEDGLSAQSLKMARYRSSHLRKMKSQMLWSADEPAPSYSEKKIGSKPSDGKDAQDEGPDENG